MRKIETVELLELDANELTEVNGGDDPGSPPPHLNPGGTGWTDALVNWFKEKIVGPMNQMPS